MAFMVRTHTHVPHGSTVFCCVSVTHRQSPAARRSRGSSRHLRGPVKGPQGAEHPSSVLTQVLFPNKPIFHSILPYLLLEKTDPFSF